MRAGLLLWFCLLAEDGMSQQPPKTPQVPSQQQPDRALEDKEKSQAVEQGPHKPVPTVPTTSSHVGGEESQGHVQKSQHEPSEFWTVGRFRVKVTDTLLVIFTFILAFATIRLWVATKDLVEDSRGTARLELRAYLAVHDIKLSLRPVVQGSVAEWRIEVVNTGRTPAYNVQRLYKTDMLPSGSPPDSVAISNLAGTPSDYTVSPGDRMPFLARHDLSEEELRFLAQGWALYVYGRVRYEDIYRVGHRTHFCWWATIEDGTLAVRGVCERHNDAD